MKSKIVFLSLVLSVCFSCAAGHVGVKSPAGDLAVRIETDSTGHLSYSIVKAGKTVIFPSPLGVVVDNDDLGGHAEMGKPQTSLVNETYSTRGVHSTAINHYRQAVIPVKGGRAGTEWYLEVRVFPDAVACRYRIPGEGERHIGGESSAWQVVPGTTLWYQTYHNKDYERPFTVMKPDSLNKPVRFMTSAAFRLPQQAGYMMIGEANLIDYSDMALETSGRNRFNSLFHNSPDGWMHTGEIVSPWRVVVVTEDLNDLVNTDVFQNLCPAPPPELAGAEWIRPGKSNWHWMVTGPPVFEEQKTWIDRTAELGFEYYLIDDGWQRWSEGERGQWEMMRELVEYAAGKGVDTWAWVHTRELTTAAQREEYIARAKKIGLTGLKVDFMGAADPVWVQWYDDILKETADAGLMIIFHGSNKPTGRERTWPHEMSRESILGREMGKQPASHDVTLPFTRFVLGHADYTPTDFRPEKLNGSTWAHELGMAVVFTSPMMVLSGEPESYLESEAASFMRELPTVWDETLVLEGSEIGQVAAFARRSGDDWYIGVINNAPAALSIDAGFLKDGGYAIEEFRDEPGQTAAWRHTSGRIDRSSKIDIDLNRDGGYVAKISPLQIL